MPHQSRWYELLRFGRNLGRAERSKDPLPADAEHWRKVNTPRGEKWVNLNAKGTYKFSDADFPAVMGWQLIGDDKNASDQRCNSDALRGLLLLSIAEMSEREKACEKTPAGLRLLAKQTVHKDMAGKMQKLICKFPSEFDQDTFEARYGHVKDEEVFKDKPEAWGKFKAHIQALTFKDLPQAYKQAQWHFHPVAFIKHMRQCGWLSHDELVQCIPKQALRTGAGVFWEEVRVKPSDSVESTVPDHRIPLNRMMRKYGISNKPLRIASFLGNAIQETGWFRSLQESGGAGQWYAPWFGRGFLQLTHADNYFGYWQWRGRSVPSGLVKALRDATKREAEKPYQDRNKTALQDGNFTELTPEMKVWRTDVDGAQGTTRANIGEALVAPTDSAGFYWAKLKMARYADEQHTLELVRVPTVNSGEKTYYRSSAFWRASAAVNLPSKVEVLYDTRLNGFDARCCAYGVALAVLTEIKFSDAKKLNSLDFPEGYTPRRVK